MANPTHKPNELFDCLHDLGAKPLNSEMHEIEEIVFNSERAELMKLEAIQNYLLDHGANDEDINDAILVIKGLKTQEQVDREKAQRNGK
jgi:hypothetical protein